MRKSLEHLRKYRYTKNRVVEAHMKQSTNYIGTFILTIPKMTKDKFKVIVSIDMDEWEHVSISVAPQNRILAIEEREYVRAQFFREEEAGEIYEVQSPICLHLWRNIITPGKKPT